MATRAALPMPSHPDVIAFVEALARAHVARDIAAARAVARKDSPVAHPDLRPVL